MFEWPFVFASRCCVIILLLGIRGLPATANDVYRALAVPRSGTPFQASLSAIADDWTLIFDHDGSERRLPAGELTYWGSLAEGEAQTQLLLAPGGRLFARLVRVQEDQVTVSAAAWKSMVLPRAMVRGMLFQLPGELLQRDQSAQRVRDYRGLQDHFWLANGDVMQGKLLTSPSDEDPVSLFGLDRLDVVFGDGGARTSVPVNRVHAMAFASKEDRIPSPEDPPVYVGFRNGTCLPVQSLSTNDRQTRLTVSSGLTLVAETARIMSQIVMLQPAGMKLTYLSDLEPIDEAVVPYLDTTWSYGRDRNVFGGRLRKEGRVHRRGLGMHSTSRLVYEMSRKYRQFAAELALDDLARDRGSVTYRVFLERDGQWSSVYESPIVRGTDAPLPVRVDIDRAARIALVVDCADHGDVLDCANWLHARLIE